MQADELERRVRGVVSEAVRLAARDAKAAHDNIEVWTSMILAAANSHTTAETDRLSTTLAGAALMAGLR